MSLCLSSFTLYDILFPSFLFSSPFFSIRRRWRTIRTPCVYTSKVAQKKRERDVSNLGDSFSGSLQSSLIISSSSALTTVLSFKRVQLVNFFPPLFLSLLFYDGNDRMKDNLIFPPSLSAAPRRRMFHG